MRRAIRSGRISGSLTEKKKMAEIAIIDLVDNDKELSEFGKLISRKITHGEQSVVEGKENASKGEVMRGREHGKRKLSMEEKLDSAIS